MRFGLHHGLLLLLHNSESLGIKDKILLTFIIAAGTNYYSVTANFCD